MEDDDKTTEAPPVEDKKEDPTPPPAADDGVKARVDKLEEALGAISEQLALLTPDPHDSTPTKRPWLHRGGR